MPTSHNHFKLLSLPLLNVECQSQGVGYVVLKRPNEAETAPSHKSIFTLYLCFSNICSEWLLTAVAVSLYHCSV